MLWTSKIYNSSLYNHLVHCTPSARMDSTYLYLTNTDNLSIFPKNTPNAFTVALPKPLHLKGQWEVALWDVYIKCKNEQRFRNTGVYIACSAVVDSYANSQYKQILRHVIVERPRYRKDFIPMQYVRVDNTNHIENITIEILDENTLVKTSLPILQVNCTLHFKCVKA